MNTMAPTRPTELHRRRVRLTAGPAAAAEARRQVQAAICAWDVPVDPGVAVLLTSELVTNAIGHEAGETVALAITCSCGQLRVDVHDTSCSMPVLVDAPADAETGRGLMLVASLSADWGFYLTPAGKAVYFTLAFAARPGRGRRPRPAAGSPWGGEPRPPPRFTGPAGPRRRFPRPVVTSARWCAGQPRGRCRSASARRASSGCGRRGSRPSAGIAAAWRRSPG